MRGAPRRVRRILVSELFVRANPNLLSIRERQEPRTQEIIACRLRRDPWAEYGLTRASYLQAVTGLGQLADRGAQFAARPIGGHESLKLIEHQLLRSPESQRSTPPDSSLQLRSRAHTGGGTWRARTGSTDRCGRLHRRGDRVFIGRFGNPKWVLAAPPLAGGSRSDSARG